MESLSEDHFYSIVQECDIEDINSLLRLTLRWRLMMRKIIGQRLLDVSYITLDSLKPLTEVIHNSLKNIEKLRYHKSAIKQMSFPSEIQFKLIIERDVLIVQYSKSKTYKVNVKLRILSTTPFICRIIYHRCTPFRSFLHVLFPNLQIITSNKKCEPIYH